ncbi:MAG: hypothetical protein IT210_19135 [Armatimonadetes bacterium]|nr:hypothetical protein [Armatimonadota bacterium]
MLFQGWSAAKPWLGGQPFRGHPYHPSHNIQGFDGSPGGETGPDLDSPLVRERQAAYIRQVVDTVGDLENILYEVASEGGTKGWDWWVVDTIHGYERARPLQHPVGITAHGSETNDDLLEGPADWISPGSSNWPDLMTDPRPADGSGVCLLDTDHVFGVGGDQKWVWKGFLRGYNVWYMDPYDDPEWQPVLKNQNFLDIASEPARQAMGHTRTCAARIDLAKSYPDPAIASTGYCLAVPGQAYLLYRPEGGPMMVDLTDAPDPFAAFWIHPATGQETPVGQVEGRARRDLTPPFAGDAVLLLKAAG